jgi:nucleoside-diphosphate-sugar epimerase
MFMVYLTGYSGFIGQNLERYLNMFQVETERISRCDLNDSSVILSFRNGAVVNLVGKSHDLRSSSNYLEYYQVNTELTIKVFDAFIASDANVFITLSSVKAVADEIDGNLGEDHTPCPTTHYGKSKLLAEQYILSKSIPEGKRVYILRPCMVHGPGNKGNLNLLFNFASKGFPWPLGAFDNKRSFCSIDNLMFVIKELIERHDIASGVYNLADDEALSTNELISLIAQTRKRRARVYKIPKVLVEFIAFLGDVFYFPLNSERLHKLTSSYVVCNIKIKSAIGKALPVSSREGILKTFNSFNN